MKRVLWIGISIIIGIAAISGCSQSPDTTPDATNTYTPYGGKLLGANIVDTSTVEFSIYAPSATSVNIAGEFNSWSTTADALSPVTSSPGVWSTRLTISSPHGKAYKFVLNGSTWTSDPYSKANKYSNGDSVIIDPTYSWSDSSWQRPARTAMVVYEMHIKDFTSHSSSGVANPGKYKGVQQKIAYLTGLGINAVEFMPLNEFPDGGYSWGYNPVLFFAPESGYGTDNVGAQVTEFQDLINALHNAGIAVILDVVYNHTGSSDNYLWIVDSDYYFEGTTPWGNKLDVTQAYVKKLVYDNMKYFMDYFHVDGFRLDSTENIDAPSIREVVDKLVANGYSDRYYIFEEFNGANNSAIQSYNQTKTKAVISSWGTGYKDNVWDAINNGVSSTHSLGTPTYYSHDNGWTYPGEAINYHSSHDEGTLAGRWSATTQQVKVAMTHLLTAMGMPMFWMGEEFMRIHHGNDIADPTLEANNIMDWSLAVSNTNLIQYVANVVKLRTSHPALQLSIADPATAGKFGWFTADWESAVGYTYKNVAGDSDFVVLINYEATSKSYSVTFPKTGTWYVMSDGTLASSAATGLSSFTAPVVATNITVPAQAGIIYMSQTIN